MDERHVPPEKLPWSLTVTLVGLTVLLVIFTVFATEKALRFLIL